MAFIHGKNSAVLVNAKDLSAYVNKMDFDNKGDTHDVTTYGQNAKVYQGGLTDATITIEGIYDSTAVNGPRAVLQPLAASLNVVVAKHRPEGTGTGKPEDTVNVIVKGYKESSPVADMIKWTAELQCSGSVVTAAQ